jgi:hypothetical protein
MLPGQNSMAIRADHPDWKCSKLLPAEKTVDLRGFQSRESMRLLIRELLKGIFGIGLSITDNAAGDTPAATVCSNQSRRLRSVEPDVSAAFNEIGF